MSRLAAEGLGDRRALGKALRGVETVAGSNGERRFRLRYVVKALAQRQVEAETARLRLRVQALEAQLEADDDAHVTESEAKRRKRVAEAELLEIDLAVKRHEYAPIAEIEFAVTAVLSGVQQRLLGVGSKVAVDVAAESDPAVAQELIDSAVHEILTEIADLQTVRATRRYAQKLDALLKRHRQEIRELVAEDPAA